MQVFKQSFSAVAALGIVSVVWGTTWVASRQGVLYMPALQLAGIRQLLGGFAFLAYYLPKGLRFPKGAEWNCIGHGFRTDWDLYHILHTFRRLIEF
ncbi:MAG: EamA family transporter [Saprospiraceae bacterium]|nr:EamA family transporter [Saprospiraceae bacterium]